MGALAHACGSKRTLGKVNVIKLPMLQNASQVYLKKGRMGVTKAL